MPSSDVIGLAWPGHVFKSLGGLAKKAPAVNFAVWDLFRVRPLVSGSGARLAAGLERGGEEDSLRRPKASD